MVMNMIYKKDKFNKLKYLIGILFVISLLFFIQLINSRSTRYNNNSPPYYRSKLLNLNKQQQQTLNIYQQNDDILPSNNIMEEIQIYQDAIDKRIQGYKSEHEKSQKSREKKHEKNPQETRIPGEDFYQGLHREFIIKPNFLISKYSTNTTGNKNDNILEQEQEQEQYNINNRYKVSIVTQTTVDRLEKVKLMAEKWQAPISIAVYVLNTERDIDILKEYVESCEILKEYADFHLLIANNTRYPVNNLRNLSIKYAMTDYVFILDVDFLPPIGLHSYISHYIEEQQKNQLQLENDIYQQDSSVRHTAFVVPSFSSSIHPKNHPDDKLKLTELVYNQLVEPSNLDLCWNCHSPTNFTHWFVTSEPYQIKYKWIYEPYLIYNRSEGAQFDERLKGYGFDKNSHSFTLAVSGFRFVVLPHAFIIHINHESSNWQGPSVKDQLWDSLSIACDIIREVKTKYQYDLNKSLFNEPILNECFTDLHW